MAKPEAGPLSHLTGNGKRKSGLAFTPGLSLSYASLHVPIGRERRDITSIVGLFPRDLTKKLAPAKADLRGRPTPKGGTISHRGGDGAGLKMAGVLLPKDEELLNSTPEGGIDGFSLRSPE